MINGVRFLFFFFLRKFIIGLNLEIKETIDDIDEDAIDGVHHRKNHFFFFAIL